MESSKIHYRFFGRQQYPLLFAGLVAVFVAFLLSPQAFGQTDEIRIGTLMPLTGAGGPFGAEMQKAVIAAVNDRGRP